MESMVEAEYRRGLRKLLQEEGVPVAVSERERARWPDSPDLWVSPYGWVDDQARDHCTEPPAGSPNPARYGRCRWVLPEKLQVDEVTYSEFVDTFTENSSLVGINGEGVDEPIVCACGRYTGVVLRHEASLGEVLRSLLGLCRTSMTI